MTLRGGDPRTFDREFYERLTRLERWAAIRRYIIRIGPGYRNNPRYPDHEAAASVARHSILMGEFVLGYLAASFWVAGAPGLILVVEFLGVTALASVEPTAVLVVSWSCGVVSVTLIWLRARQVNRWFVERYPTLDQRLFWRLSRKEDDAQ